MPDAHYYVTFIGFQHYLTLFSQIHRRLLFFSLQAALASGQGHVTIMTNDMWAKATNPFWAVVA